MRYHNFQPDALLFSPAVLKVRQKIIIILLGLFGFFWPEIGGAEDQAQAAATHCRYITILDGQNELVGVEDVAIDPVGQQAFLSAQNRRAVKQAMATGLKKLPEGGLYRIPLVAFATTNQRVRAENLTATLKLRQGLRPHGIGLLYEDSAVIGLTAVNHGYLRTGAGWQPYNSVEHFVLTQSGWHHQGSIPNLFLPGSSHRFVPDTTYWCNLNDVVPLTKHMGLVTADRKWCSSFWIGSETVFGLEQSAILTYEMTELAGYSDAPPLFDNLYYANGLVRLETSAGQFIVAAETRGKRLALFRLIIDDATKAVRLDLISRLELDFAPDNLTLTQEAPDNEAVLWVAGFSNLMEIGLYHANWPGFSQAGWEIWRVDAQALIAGTAIPEQVLVGDGAMMSAVTGVAVTQDGMILAGSALDPGMLVCQVPEPETAKKKMIESMAK